MFEILVPKTGSIRDLHSGLQKKANIDDETMQYVRIYEVHGGKIFKELPLDHSVTTMTDFLDLYAEVIPEEERNAEDGESVIYCFHFDKEPNKPHGVPFRFVMKPVSSTTSA